MNSFQTVDDGLVARLREAGITEQLPKELCNNCYGQFNVHLTSGSKLLAREKARENRKQQMWSQRVVLVKKGRQALEHNVLVEAAACYEKYLRLMELVFDAPKGKLSPNHFKESARTQELTIIASVLWDLLRIYDHSSKHSSRQLEVAQLLADFLPFTPVYPDIIKKAQAFSRTAKNPQAIRLFLKASNVKRPRCFIATSAFNGPEAIEVQLLRWYRDHHLQSKPIGRVFVAIYYFLSPPMARLLDQFPLLKKPTRALLRGIIKLLIKQ